MNPEAVIFDFDQTLYNLKLDWDLLKRNLSSYFTKIGYVSNFQPLYPELNRAFLFVKSRFSERETEKYQKWAYNTIRKAEMIGLKNGEPLPTVKELLKSLDKKMIKIGIVSSNSRKVIESAIKDSNWPMIQFIGREDVEKLKPSTEGVFQCLNKLKSNPEDTWGIGDSKVDLLAFRGAKLNRVFLVGESSRSQPQGVLIIRKAEEVLSWIT